MIVPSEALVTAYKEWDESGRGWKNYPKWVVPEPEFVPLWWYERYALKGLQATKDTGRVPSFLERAGKLFTRDKAEPPPAPDEEFDEVLPDPLTYLVDLRVDVVEFKVVFPSDDPIPEGLIERFLLSLSMARFPMGFEIVGDSEAISVLFIVAEEDANRFEHQFHSHFPGLYLGQSVGVLEEAWQNRKSGHHFVADLGLSEDMSLPLISKDGRQADPYVGLVGALRDLAPSEFGFLQLSFQPVENPWGQEILGAVTTEGGNPIYSNMPELPGHAREKVSAPLYGARIRIGSFASAFDAAKARTRDLFASLSVVTSGAPNSLIPLEDNLDDEEFKLAEVVMHRSRRSGMLLNLHELAGLVRFPSPAVVDPKIRGSSGKTAPAGDFAAGSDLILGSNTHLDETVEVGLTADQRTRHTYIIGASGTGKSNMLLNLLIQDANNGEGFAVLDPHGQLIDDLLPHIPRSRHKDVILFDPADEECPVGLNILKAHTEQEKNLLSSDLIAVFERLSSSWGDQMSAILHNAILAFLEHPTGGTLADLRRFLNEKSFRDVFVPDVVDEEVRYFFEVEFPTIRGAPQTSVVTRLGKFLRSKLVRNVVANPDAKLDVAKAMDERKILLARLSEGAIGEENAYLFAAVLISKIYQAALGRQSVSAKERSDFWLYIDEFHHFVTPSMAAILSGARKYRLGLVMAHQELAQLFNRDPEVASAVLSNPYTRIAFRVGDSDAKKLAEGFGDFDARDLTNLGVGHALCRIEQAQHTFNLKTPLAPTVPEPEASLIRDRVVRLSRKQWGSSPPSRRTTSLEPRSDEQLPKEEERENTKVEPKPQPGGKTPTSPSDPVTKAEQPTPKKQPEPDKPQSKDVSPKKLEQAADDYEKRHGRGGDDHKHVQQFVKRIGESFGYRATVEAKHESGWIDVALEKDGETIAVEIQKTTTAAHEFTAIKRRLEQGCAFAIALSVDPNNVATSEVNAKRLPDELASRVRCVGINDFPRVLADLQAEGQRSEKEVKGWKVKMDLVTLPTKEIEAREREVARITTDCLARLCSKEDSVHE